MADFSIDPEFADDLAWIREFVHTEIEPLELVHGGDEDVIYDKSHPVQAAVIRPLQQEVRARGLWSAHLTPELGGQGFGQVRLAYMNEILGRSSFAPTVFGTQAPDSGNAEILSHYGTPAQKDRYLRPLLEGLISSTYAMTEPQGGADPAVLSTRATRDGGDWLINGEKWFASSFGHAAFVIVMAVTDPEASVYKGTSMFLVPAGTDGMEIVRKTGLGHEPIGNGNHPYIRFTDVRVPAESLLGSEGKAFEVAQARLGAGRLHHAMRTVGAMGRCLDMIAERALSRTTKGSLLADKQLTQVKIADAWIELTQYRLQVLHAAWSVDTYGVREARREIAGVKVALPKMMQDAITRAIQLHGSLGISNEMPLTRMMVDALVLGLADGPTEVHQLSLARDVLKDYAPISGMWPSEHLPIRRETALAVLDERYRAAAASEDA